MVASDHLFQILNTFKCLAEVHNAEKDNPRSVWTEMKIQKV